MRFVMKYVCPLYVHTLGGKVLIRFFFNVKHLRLNILWGNVYILPITIKKRTVTTLIFRPQS